jgi:hypothetical protein
VLTRDARRAHASRSAADDEQVEVVLAHPWVLMVGAFTRAGRAEDALGKISDRPALV